MTDICRRCGVAPGTPRTYYPGQPFSLAGVQLKFSVKRTVACDGCWGPFAAYIAARVAGESVCRPEYHEARA